MFLFLISNCLTVIEVLVNFGTEPGPACWEVCHCEGWSKSWFTYAFFFFSIREWIVTVKVWNQYCFCIFHSTKHYFMVKWRKAHHRLGTSFNMWAAAWQKPTKWLMRRRKTQSSLGICPVWSVFAVRIKNLALLATRWVHSLCWAHRSFCWLHVKLWSNSTNGTEVQTNEHMNGQTKTIYPSA